MNIQFLFVFIISYISSLIRTNKLQILNPINFTESLTKYDVVVVEFFSPSMCDFSCEALEGKMFNISLESERFNKEYNKTIFFAKINAESDQRFVNQFKLTYYPTLYVLYDRYESKYEVTSMEVVESADNMFKFIDS